jgi:alanyl-tRNA synthetase
MIPWAWEFLIDVLKLDPARLRVTVYRDDEEAFALWTRVGMPAERISRFDDTKNYWPAGAITEKMTVPCGPCSEIFFDLQPDKPFDLGWDGEGDRWLEIWNLVFPQFNGVGEENDFHLEPLTNRNIDTGMGLERTAAAINGLAGPFETDVLRPLIARLEELSGKTYTSSAGAPLDIAFRRVADHARAATFCLGDGVTPDNTGRGYVLRRLLRRAVVAGRERLGFDGPFLADLVPAVIEVLGDTYPELASARPTSPDQIKQEEALFGRTLENGLARLKDALEDTREPFTGRQAFHLFETYGLPFEVTREVAAERGVFLDAADYRGPRTRRANAPARRPARSRSST